MTAHGVQLHRVIVKFRHPGDSSVSVGGRHVVAVGDWMTLTGRFRRLPETFLVSCAALVSKARRSWPEIVVLTKDRELPCGLLGSSQPCTPPWIETVRVDSPGREPCLQFGGAFCPPP